MAKHKKKTPAKKKAAPKKKKKASSRRRPVTRRRTTGPKPRPQEKAGIIKRNPRKHDFSRATGIVVLSDFHVGCKLAIMPRDGLYLDEHFHVGPSKEQKKLNDILEDFMDNHVPNSLGKDGKFVLVFNGDAVDGAHHNALTTWTNNIKDQRRAAELLLRPIIEHPNCVAYFHIRGTEVHVGGSAEWEEELARDLGAIPDERGNHARNELWIDIQGYLGHFLHHVGTTSRVAYESSAVMSELSEMYVHAAQWHQRTADFLVRSHRHRYIEIRVPSANGYAIALTTPCFQGRTPFVYKIAGGRQSLSQYGGMVIVVKEDELYTRPYVVTPSRTRIVDHV